MTSWLSVLRSWTIGSTSYLVVTSMSYRRHGAGDADILGDDFRIFFRILRFAWLDSGYVCGASLVVFLCVFLYFLREGDLGS